MNSNIQISIWLFFIQNHLNSFEFKFHFNLSYTISIWIFFIQILFKFLCSNSIFESPYNLLLFEIYISIPISLLFEIYIPIPISKFPWSNINIYIYLYLSQIQNIWIFKQLVSFQTNFHQNFSKAAIHHLETRKWTLMMLRPSSELFPSYWMSSVLNFFQNPFRKIFSKLPGF